MNKYIGFDIDSKKIVACVVENGKRDIYQTLRSDIGSMRKFLKKHKLSGHRVELAFEISGHRKRPYIFCKQTVHRIEPAYLFQAGSR